MDFSFFDKLTQAKNEETDGFWKGLNRLYYSFAYDYLYPNPSSVMAFIENHDTDRFLGNGCDTLALKQALALLLTVNRIPQLYYGTEILMNGTKEVTDGNVRKDFPGGFPGDEHNAFTKETRTKEEQAMFQWTSQLLHWRQGNETITNTKATLYSRFLMAPANLPQWMWSAMQKLSVLLLMPGMSLPIVITISPKISISSPVKA